MKKLTKDDIKLLGEGPQIKKYILLRYKSVADFYDNNQLSITLDSLRTYLARKKIYSETLKLIIVNCFNVGYSDIVLTDQEQARRFAWDVNANIKLYNEREDLDTFRAIEQLLEKFDLPVEKAMMLRAKANNCFYRNVISQSIEWYEMAIERMGRLDLDRLVQLYCELADVLGREQLDNKALMYFDMAEEIIKDNKIREDMLFRYYYWRGKFEVDRNNTAAARELFLKASTNASNLEERTVALQNIGSTYFKESNYKEAIEIYDKVIGMYDPNDYVRISTVLNNKAMVMIDMELYAESIQLSTKALFYVDSTNDYKRYILYKQTYTKARYLMGYKEECLDYFDDLKLASTKLVDKSCLIEDINELAALINEKYLLQRFADAILQMEDNQTQGYKKDYIVNLQSCVALIYKKIRRLEGVG